MSKFFINLRKINGAAEKYSSMIKELEEYIQQLEEVCNQLDGASYGGVKSSIVQIKNELISQSKELKVMQTVLKFVVRTYGKSEDRITKYKIVIIRSLADKIAISNEADEEPEEELEEKPVAEPEDEIEEIVNKILLIELGVDHISDEMVNDLNRVLAKYNIRKNIEIAMFLANAAHESKESLTEIDVGNQYVVDGVNYCGGGFMQLTGYDNYKAFADQMLKEGLVQLDSEGNNPIMTGGAEYVAANLAWESAGWHWSVSWNNCNKRIEEGADFYTICQVINGGPDAPNEGIEPNGIGDRLFYYKKAQEIFKLNK